MSSKKLSFRNKGRKRNKSNTDWNERKFSPFTDDMIVYMKKKTKKATKKAPITELSQDKKYICTKSITSLCKYFE